MQGFRTTYMPEPWSSLASLFSVFATQANLCPTLPNQQPPSTITLRPLPGTVPRPPSMPHFLQLLQAQLQLLAPCACQIYSPRRDLSRSMVHSAQVGVQHELGLNNETGFRYVCHFPQTNVNILLPVSEFDLK